MNLADQINNDYKSVGKAYSTQTAKHKKNKGLLRLNTRENTKLDDESTSYNEKLNMLNYQYTNSQHTKLKSFDDSFLENFKMSHSNRFIRTNKENEYVGTQNTHLDSKIEERNLKKSWTHLFVGLFFTLLTIICFTFSVYIKIYGFKWKYFMQGTPEFFKGGKYEIDWEQYFERI